MAGIVVVDDPGDPRLADYARLTDVRLRTSMEPAHGLFVAEGDKVIRRAVAAGYRVRSMLVTRDKLAGLADVADACPGPVYVISHEVAEQVTGYRVHRGALAPWAPCSPSRTRACPIGAAGWPRSGRPVSRCSR
jgi:tRNA G18 (ribose-2'-O)-methylase SpoU